MNRVMPQWMQRNINGYVRTSIFLVVFLCVFSWYTNAFAATIQTYSDRLSDSAPNAQSNHTITFTTNVPIPPNGFIRFTPDDGDFTIPATNFDIDNVSLSVNTGSGFIDRTNTSTASAVDDGVAIVTGSSGNIEITLNATDGIPAYAKVRMLIGRNTPNATSTDVGITNPPTTGTFAYQITAGDGTTNSTVTGRYAIIDAVHIENVDTRENIAPYRYNGAPTGDLAGTSLFVELTLRTDEFAMCRYSTMPNISYASMGIEFTSYFSAIHSIIVPVASSTSYSFYVRCTDDEGNINLDDYLISFTVLPPPTGTPGDSGSNQGQGTGGGTGTGSSGSGSGSSGGGGGGASTASGGGSGGGGGSGSGPSSGSDGDGGGLEGTNKPYQSGDGEVIITGYAFPRSTVVSLVDGKVAKQTTSDGAGAFSITLDAIARGAYSFGVYGIDKNGVKSSTFATTFTVTGGRASTLSNINVMPSIKVTPNPVDPNSTVTVSGYTIPEAVVTIENQTDKSSVGLKTFTATSDGNGAWSVAISTDGFAKGTYKVRAKAKQDVGVSTNFSGYTFYGVGETVAVTRNSDLNRDGKVNLTDFSILLFWWNTAGGNSNPPADINGDGKVSLTDFSILIFNWTG